MVFTDIVLMIAVAVAAFRLGVENRYEELHSMCNTK